MRRATALVLLLALSVPQAAPLVAAARFASPASTTAPAEAAHAHHHPPGCPWQGTPNCPHAHHGPSSEPTWSPCAEVPHMVGGEARLAWAPPEVASCEAPAPALPAPESSAGGQVPPSGPHPDVEIPPPRTARAV
jgi:hypothetical protein